MDQKYYTKEETQEVLHKIYDALCEKGYSPSSQLAGYILSEDPVYIPDWNNARGIIRHIDRDELLHLIIDYYFDTKLTPVPGCLVRIPDTKEWYPNDDSTQTGVHASQSPTYPVHQYPKPNIRLQ